MIASSLTRALRPGQELYRRLSDALWRRLHSSQREMSARYEQMAKNEERFSVYVPATEADKKRERKREQEGQMNYRTLEIPYSYATLMATHTYLSTVFLARNPAFQVQGRHGESEQQTQAMEALLDYQVQVGEMLVPLYFWLLDPGKYGFGVVGHYWDREVLRTRQTLKVPRTFLGLPLPGTEQEVTKVTETTAYEGSRLYNVRPQDWFPDPRVALWNFQRGEFVGRYTEIAWHEVTEGERTGRYINVDVLRKNLKNETGNAVVDMSRDQGGRSSTLPDADADWAWYQDDAVAAKVKAHEIIVRLSPKEWGLGEENGHELWVFTRTTDGILIEAAPMQSASTKFPFDILIAEPDAYNLFAPSLLERLQPLNDVVSWLINTHMYNVRASINNQFIIDPSMVMMKDIENPEPGKAIRLKPTAYGKDVRMALTQLQVADITRSHIQDSQVMIDFLQRVSGVNDSIMGMVGEQGGRRTATEVRTSTTFGINRLKTVCEFASAMGFSPLTQKLIQNTQSNYDAKMKLRLVGDIAALSPQVLQVDPQSIIGFYDFVPVDGALPIDRFAQFQMWNNMLGQMARVPAILMQYDIGKIFAWVARLGGIRNLQQMRVQVVPDAALATQAQAGNVVPLREAAGVPTTPQPRPQAPGMGSAL